MTFPSIRKMFLHVEKSHVFCADGIRWVYSQEKTQIHLWVASQKMHPLEQAPHLQASDD